MYMYVYTCTSKAYVLTQFRTSAIASNVEISTSIIIFRHMYNYTSKSQVVIIVTIPAYTYFLHFAIAIHIEKSDWKYIIHDRFITS